MTVALTLVPFWRAGAMKVARDLTVAPAVVALVGAWAVVARAGGVPVAGVVDDGGAARGLGRRGRPQERDRAGCALIAVAGVGRQADAEAVAVRLALGHVAAARRSTATPACRSTRRAWASPAVHVATSRSSSRAEGRGIRPIAAEGEVPAQSPMLVTSMEPVRTSPGRHAGGRQDRGAGQRRADERPSGVADRGARGAVIAAEAGGEGDAEGGQRDGEARAGGGDQKSTSETVSVKLAGVVITLPARSVMPATERPRHVLRRDGGGPHAGGRAERDDDRGAVGRRTIVDAKVVVALT